MESAGMKGKAGCRDRQTFDRSYRSPFHAKRAASKVKNDFSR
jgi:hypothetical protein